MKGIPEETRRRGARKQVLEVCRNPLLGGLPNLHHVLKLCALKLTFDTVISVLEERQPFQQKWQVYSAKLSRNHLCYRVLQ